MSYDRSAVATLQANQVHHSVGVTGGMVSSDWSTLQERVDQGYAAVSISLPTKQTERQSETSSPSAPPRISDD